jgi:la-related protein 1
LLTIASDYYFSVDNLLKDMYLRRKMDSQGFVTLEFIAGFNRIKQLSTDIELIKLVCQQSSVVQYRTGEDGQDRLRRREGWEQWVLNMADRDAAAQNEGPKELHQPPVPHPNGFDQANPGQWSMSALETPDASAKNSASPQVNGHSVDNNSAADNVPNGTGSENLSEAAVPEGLPVGLSVTAVSANTFPS